MNDEDESKEKEINKIGEEEEETERQQQSVLNNDESESNVKCDDGEFCCDEEMKVKEEAVEEKKNSSDVEMEENNPNLVLTVDEEEEEDQRSREGQQQQENNHANNETNYYVNLNMNNLDMKTNARRKFDPSTTKSSAHQSDIDEDADDEVKTAAASTKKKQIIRLSSSSSSIEDNSNIFNNVAANENEEKSSKNQLDNKQDDDVVAYLWTDTEALLKQHEQTGASACGATAILNVLKALNFDYDMDQVCSQVKINLRIPESEAKNTTLCDYLLSRSVAGMNSLELIENVKRVTRNKVNGRFFAFYPPRDVNLSDWLAYWLRKKAVPVALLNLQKTPVWGFIPDAWHHQMIYACDSSNVYLTNPLETKSVATMMNELTSESVLLVRSHDIVKRFNANSTSLLELINLSSLEDDEEERKRWHDMNVIGQVLTVLRDSSSTTSKPTTCQQQTPTTPIDETLHELTSDEINEIAAISAASVAAAAAVAVAATSSSSTSSSSTSSSSSSSNNSTNSNNNNNQPSIFSYVSIPASYKSGICLFAYADSDLFKEIVEAEELPLLHLSS